MTDKNTIDKIKRLRRAQAIARPELRVPSDNFPRVASTGATVAGHQVRAGRYPQAHRRSRSGEGDAVIASRDPAPVAVEGGATCSKCGQVMQRFEHSKNWQPPPRRGFFRYWDRCLSCDHFQNYGVAKVKVA